MNQNFKLHLRLELWFQCLKNLLQSSKSTYLDVKTLSTQHLNIMGLFKLFCNDVVLMKYKKKTTLQCIFLFMFNNHHQCMLKHGFPWFFLTIHPYQLSLLIGSLDGIQSLHRADGCKFCMLCPSIVVHGRMFLMSHPYFTCSTQYVLFILHWWFVWCGGVLVVQILFSGVLLCGFVQNRMQPPCVVFI